MAPSSLHVVEPDQPDPRSRHDVIAMTRVSQANVVQRRTAESRRQGLDPKRHLITVPSPGPVLSRRDALIDRARIKRYDDAQLHLRLHEVWGLE